METTAEMDKRWYKQVLGRITVFSLELRAKEPALVKEVQWFAGRWDKMDETVIHSTGLEDNVLFLRKGKISFFLSLDFPYSKITPASISYPAHETLAAGAPYACHSISVGACELSGIRVGKFDRAEIEAASTYVEERFPMRFERPMFVSSCITNRMTYVRSGGRAAAQGTEADLYDPIRLAFHRAGRVRMCAGIRCRYGARTGIGPPECGQGHLGPHQREADRRPEVLVPAQERLPHLLP